MKLISKHITQIKSLCDSNSIKSLFAFGSITTTRFRADSDVDLIVDIDADDPLEYSDKYFDLKFNLERLLNRKIDLLEHRAVKNPYLLDEINKTKVLVYGK
jgi:predicted nucleotidyltransferase